LSLAALLHNLRFHLLTRHSHDRDSAFAVS
jgi:hypothetical protein